MAPTLADVKHTHHADRPVRIKVCFCVPDEYEKHLPKRRRAPSPLPMEAPLPRVGEWVMLGSSTAWTVTRVVHEWRSTTDLLVEVWLEYEGRGSVHRTPGFELTQ